MPVSNMAAPLPTDDFDPEDMNVWYFGLMSREDTNNLLLPQDSGVFLVRDSSSIKGDLVLCVKEDNKVSHYIINKIQVGGQTRLRIGDQEFSSLAALLTFYKTHYLDTTHLMAPVPREKYRGKFDFAGRDPDDLPFKKGDILTILRKDEPQWWHAMNSAGDVGSIPVPYIDKVDERHQFTSGHSIRPAVEVPEGDPPPYTPINVTNGQMRKLPAKAVVIRQRIPNAYDTKALKLEVGDVLLVTKMNVDGQWEGETKQNKSGFFPFNYVKFVDSDSAEADDERL